MTEPHLIEHVPEHLLERWRYPSVYWARLAIGGVTAFWIPIGTAVAWVPFRRSPGLLQLVVVCFAGITLLVAWSLLGLGDTSND